MTAPYVPQTYTLYADYDGHGQARQVTVSPPEGTSLETVREIVTMLFNAGHNAVLPSLAETRRMTVPPLAQSVNTDLWSQYQ
jgi:hypothetical protein